MTISKLFNFLFLMKLQDLIKNPSYKKKFVLEKLLCHYLNKTREELWTNDDQELPEEIVSKIQQDYHSYEVENKPLEYLLWYVEFFWTKFIVNENTLVPRPETEYMITAITEYIQWIQDSENILLDIGTWSWVLWCSVLLQNPKNFNKVYLADISEKALEVAKRNYEHLIKNDYNPNFLISNLCDFLKDYQEDIKNKNIILVANLPYIPTQTFEENAPTNVQKREPKLAFIGWDDWLDLYREMFKQLQELTKECKTLTMFLEMITRQVDILNKEFGKIMNFEEVKTFHFNIRIVKAKFK